MPDPTTATAAAPPATAGPGSAPAPACPSAPARTDSADAFRAVQDRAECTFARRSRLVGMPAHTGPDAYAAGLAAGPALHAFTARAASDRLDGFVVELTDPAHGATPAAVAATTRALLAGVLTADGDRDLAGLEGAEEEHWWFRAFGTRWFALVFAPSYGPESPRHTFGSASTFVLLQPVEAFDRHASPRGAAIAESVREDIRDRYAAGGRPYDAELAAQDVESLKFVWPHGPADAPVRWWERSAPPADAAGRGPAAEQGTDRGTPHPVARALLADVAAAAAATHAGPRARTRGLPDTASTAGSRAGARPPAAAGAPAGPPPTGARDLAADLLVTATAALADAVPPVDRETARGLLAGLAGLALDGPHRRVPLYTALPGTGLPAALRPVGAHGAPEEDVFRLALAAACPGAPWPDGPADPAALAAAVRVLGGRLGCRVPALAAVAARHLLHLLPAADAAGRRHLLRRLAWLTDSRAAGAQELLLGLTGPGDPLVHLPAVPPAPTPATGAGGPDEDEEPLPLADWHREPPAPDEERRLGGRVRAVRRHRGATFADLTWGGRTVQLSLPPAGGPARIRPGDLLAVRGRGGRSRTGAAVLLVDEVLRHRPGRSARPLRATGPDQVGEPPVAGLLRPRLTRLGFTEAASPLLTEGYFGGRARPFATRQADRDRPLYLRVTTELDLLRRLAEGRTRVYEIGPSFRNEPLRGAAAKEFGMLEAYAADLRLDAMAELVADLVADVLGDPRRPRWTTFDEAFADTAGAHPDDTAALHRLAARTGLPDPRRFADPYALAQRLWRGTYRHRLPGVALVHRIPGPASPFIAGEGRSARRVWLSVDGVELAEISANERDPDRLARRLAAQFAGDPHPVHRDYGDVLETFAAGVPPCVGVGLGLTRLAELRAARRTTAQEPPP
ncbi:amino acid--tRNA ligase-related protein [Streptomyces sp. NRRL S-87]|uniref:amino acid--tRNA ligase-related protein n=1 Tax=Streptomyces sp. NRRL S-87 TaxID=1463920 RepID=UPI00068DA321|nr:amino acid--tRNA ligase-related protein [Streptomyces sp. NRRL S-87]